MPITGTVVSARTARTLTGLSVRSPTAPPRSAETAIAAMYSGASSGPPASAWHDTITPCQIAASTWSRAATSRSIVSATDGSGHDALDDRLLEERVEEQRGSHRDRGRGHHQRVAGEERALEGHEADLQRHLRLVGEDDEGEQELVPDRQRGQDRDGSDRGTRERERDLAEDLEAARPVDHRRLFDRARDLLEEAAEHEDPDREVGVDHRQDVAERGVHQVQLDEQDVEGDERARDRKREEREQAVVDEAAEGEAQPGERVAGRGGERQRADRHRRGVEDGVEEVRRELRLVPGLPVVAPVEAVRHELQPPVDLLVGLDRRRQRPEERNDAGPGGG